MLSVISSLSSIDTRPIRIGYTSTVWKKLVVVGDSNVGKTCLVTSLATRIFPCRDVPIIAKNYDIKIERKQMILTLCDTSGSDKHDFTRPLVYPEVDVVLLCFSVDLPSSLENTAEKWIPEIKHFCPNVPILLVANKKDARKDPVTIKRLAEKNQEPVKFEEGRCMAERINAFAYLECSAKSRKGLRKIFRSVTTAATRVRCHSLHECSFL